MVFNSALGQRSVGPHRQTKTRHIDGLTEISTSVFNTAGVAEASLLAFRHQLNNEIIDGSGNEGTCTMGGTGCVRIPS